LKTFVHDKNIFKKNERAFKDLDKDHVIELNITQILRIYKYVKMILKHYEGALEDLNNTNVLKPNNAFILKSCGDIKIC
jgi:hypothetical protein